MDVFKKIYDCIVIGDNLGGIALATLLEKRGANVLLLMNKNDNHTFYYKDYELDIDTPFIAGIERGDFFKKILCEINYDITHEFNDTNPLYQFITPDVRLNLFTDLKMQRAEFRREFHTSLDQIFKTQTIANEVNKIYCLFLEANSNILCTRNIFKIKYLEHKLKKLLVDFKEVLHKESIPDQMSSEFFVPMSNAFTYLADQTANNLHFYSNVSCNYKKITERFLNFSMLKNFFIDHFKNFRGDIENINELDGFNFKGTSLKGITLNKGAKEFFCRYIVFNGSFSAIANKLNGGLWVKGLKKILASTINKNFFFRVHYIVDQTVLPVGLHKRGIIIPDETKRPIHFCITNNTHTHQKATITASIEMPLDKKYTDEDYKQVMAYMRQSIQNLIPFFEDYIVDEFPRENVFETEEKELFNKYLRFLLASDYNYTVVNKRNPISLLQGRSISTPFSNVFIQGRSILPGFGATGEIIAAHTIADHITNKVRFY